MNKILLVEDEKNFGHILRDYLKMNGYEVMHCENGYEGMEAFRISEFDLCILDIMMPKKDGFTLASEIRAIKSDTPFIFLTARSQKEDMIKGYKLGADDYMTKPFDSELLLLKIKVILKRQSNGTFSSSSQTIYEIGSLKFNAKLRALVSSDNKTIKLSPKESALLHLLCMHRNDVLLRETALKEIWKDDNYFTGRSMDVYIVKLRKYLSVDSSVTIENLHGNGYTLSAKKN